MTKKEIEDLKHNINNPNTIIMATIEYLHMLLKKDKLDDKTLRKSIKEMKDQVDRVSKYLRSIKPDR